MAFLSPIWLIALIPWAGLTVWLLWGRRERALVPFLPLWRGTIVQKRQRRAIDLPPLALAAAIAAIFLAIFAAAGPRLFHRAKGIPQLTMIVDRGMTMSAITQGETRFVQASRSAGDAMGRFAPEAKIDLHIVPGERKEEAGSNGFDTIKKSGPTGVDNTQAVAEVARSELSRTTGPVIVITDQKLNLDNPRLIQFAPAGQVEDVGIVSLSVRASPKPSAMVRVKNQSGQIACKLRVNSDDRAVSTSIDLPPRGRERNYFVDLPTAGLVVRASLEVSDDLAMDDRAWTVRRQAWPIVEARSGIPPELQRMIEVFSKRRPASQGAQHVAVVAAGESLPSDPAAIIVDPALALHPIDLQALIVAAGPLKIQSIDWTSALAGATTADIPAGDWMPVISAGGKPVVAVRQQPARQVWVGFNSPAFARSPDFVVFWNEVFQWLGNGGDVYGSIVAGPLEGRWTRVEPADPSPPEDLGLQPGLYRDQDGAFRAVNSPAIAIPPALDIDGAARLEAFQQEQYRTPIDLGSALALAALALVLVAALAWQRRK